MIDIIWDLDDDPDGNVTHIAEHGLTRDDVGQVLESPEDIDTSHSSGRPIAFGYTAAGQYIAVVFEPIDRYTVYPVTAAKHPNQR